MQALSTHMVPSQLFRTVPKEDFFHLFKKGVVDGQKVVKRALIDGTGLTVKIVTRSRLIFDQVL